MGRAMKYIILLKIVSIYTLLSLGFISNGYSQKAKKQDVIYLKNGWIIRGELIRQNDKLRIITANKNEFVFTQQEVDRIEREDKMLPFRYKEKGFSHYTEMGALAANNNSDINVNTSAFSFQTVNGYKFNQWLFTGLGLGVDLYATETFIPLFGSIRGDFSKNRSVIPYYFVDGGYGVNITGNADESIENSGGLLLASGIGIKVQFQNNTAFLLSAGFRIQNSSQSVGDMKITNSYERLALRAGFSF
jgi:hypothetical protein